MDWLCKALLTAGSVLLVLLLARRSGHRAAGIVAALPTLTGPALAWLAHDHGDAFAANAAIASVAASAMLAVFAAVYAQVARRRGVLCALCCGGAAAALLAEPVALASGTPAGAIALAVVSCAAALRWVRVPPGHLPRQARTPIVPTALAATALGTLTVAAAPLFGSHVAGLLASLPLVSGVVVAAEHASTGHAGVAHFLRGYLVGLLVRTAFCATFAALVVPVGWVGASVAAALAATGAALLVHHLRTAKRSPVPARRSFGHATRLTRPSEGR